MNRLVSAVVISSVALSIAPAAFARDIKETRTFTKANGTKIVSHTNFHTKTDVTDEKVTATRTDGQVRTVSEKTSPDAKGGFNVSKTTTGFNGMTHTSTSSVGAGHGGHGGKA